MKWKNATENTLKPPPETEKLYDDFVSRIQERILSGEDRNYICKDVLSSLYHDKHEQIDLGESVRVSVYDPRNITLEPEYYHNIDRGKFLQVKPLIWLWMMFDKSPAGRNAHLGFKLRRMLASFIFRKLGENVKIFHNVEVSFGYNIEVGDNTIIHREVLLDDRGEIIIGKNVSISDFVNIYSHSHDTDDINKVILGSTVIGDKARITYHSTVLSGTNVGRNATLGAFALATRSIAENHINIGIPARSCKVKEIKPESEEAKKLGS